MRAPKVHERLRAVAAATVVAVVTTVLATTGAPDGRESAEASDDGAFALSVGRPDLAHVDGEDVSVALGAIDHELPAGAHEPVGLAGTRGASGMVRVHDAGGNLAGLAVVPKDDAALLGLAGDGPLDVPVTYRSTAFGLFSMQPLVATSNPGLTTLQAALVLDLPQLDTLAGALETAAADDPAYLETMPEPVLSSLDALVGAYVAEAERVAAEVGRAVPGGGSGGGGTTTTVGLRGQGVDVEDADGCEPTSGGPVIVLDPGRRDMVCVTEANHRGAVGAWELAGVSATPRWAYANATNRGVPVDEIALVPGKAVSLPGVADLVLQLSTALATGVLEDVFVNIPVELCNIVVGLFDKRCSDHDTSSATWANLVELFDDYFADAPFDVRLVGSEPRTVVDVAGLGTADGGDGSGGYVVSSWVLTVVMTMVVPAMGLVSDARGLDRPHELAGDPALRGLARAIWDERQEYAGLVVELTGHLANGDVDRALGVVGEIFVDVLEGAVGDALLRFLQDRIGESVSGGFVQAAIRELAESLVNPIKKVDMAVGAANALGTVAMVAWDIPSLSTSSRYALGYEGDLPGVGPLRPDPPGPDDPHPNPPLPGDACGLRVAVVLDASLSITEAGGVDDVRAAATGLVDTLGGTPSQVRVSSFAGFPSTRIGWTSLADPGGRVAARDAARNAPAGEPTGTNWEAALLDLVGAEPELVVFVTDGNPTAHGAGLTSTPSDAATQDFDPAALDAGVSAANLLKDLGTRIVAVGVGDINADALRQVSGPQEGSDHYTVSDFAALGPSLAAVATELCGTTLTVLHRVDGTPVGGAEYTVEAQDQAPQTTATAADGSARFGLQDGSGGEATVWPPAGFALDDLACERGGAEVAADIDDGGAVTVDLTGGPATCAFSWRSLPSDAAVVAAIARGPGEVRVLAFAPQEGAAEAVTGCLETCATVQFGVSFTGGFAVLRYDDTCAACDAPSVLQVGDRSGGGVRFRLDTGEALAVAGGWHLDLTVAAERSQVGQPAVAVGGTVSADTDLRVEIPRPPPAVGRCLVDLPERFGSALDLGNVEVTTGAGC